MNNILGISFVLCIIIVVFNLVGVKWISVNDVIFLCFFVFITSFVLGIVVEWKSHKHKWKVIDELIKDNGSFKSKVYVMQCEDCGKLKSKEVK